MNGSTVWIPAEDSILVLEDDMDRMRWFRSRVPWLTHARTVEEFAVALGTQPEYAMIFLDHDLKSEHYGQGGSEQIGTGRDAAQLMVNLGRQEPVIIHSMNPIGAKAMDAMLPNSRRMVFGSFDIQIMHL